MFEELPLSSGYARSYMLDSRLLHTESEIAAAYSDLMSFLPLASNESIAGLLHMRLCTFKDIRRSLERISSLQNADDIELFEVKHLILLGFSISDSMMDAGFADLAPDMGEAGKYLGMLDPDGNRTSTFYIYDSYSEHLARLRSRIASECDQEARLALMEEERQEECRIRADICRKLAPGKEFLLGLQEKLAKTDILLAKALQVLKSGLCIPEISQGKHMCFKGLFNPLVLESLKASGKKYIPVDIEMEDMPVVIIGANMGGKTVVLKTVALCHYCFALGMGIPAASASIAPVDEVFFISGDAQDLQTGLSSFAAEMKSIDRAVRAAAAKDRRILAVIDEPARSTNPIEGAAIVAALVEIMARNGASLLLTTHYNIRTGNCIRLKVAGLVNGIMNYRLCPAPEGEVPHEALDVAESLNISPEWTGEAKKLLEHE